MEIVHLLNTRPTILHLPDSIKRVPGRDGAEAVVVLPTGKSIPPSVPRNADGSPKVKADGRTPDGDPSPTAIDRAYWDTVKDHKEVRSWLRLGWLKLVDVGESGVSEQPHSLNAYNERTAVALIEGENNPALLADWAKSETRAKVKEAIATRLLLINKPLPKLK